ncbi:uncharacterized protein PHACADRAFT_257319 [Phanerochaete carnosa HHB-10118-sp]|uniref:MSP domain-containing protein n=1 Tax=Phanerochaete carnosa (strain HHB-10118-sp) TaxID=650164 RepID=K5WAH8_PHACS|nr:uncharacterized protein PHACADRAFT_257319 [Phanerochaete carnosa HHB-10118-sp]EKM56220.1 hypothetical protein PHACADRAFT_257319 [Phanerochaete carnosa HHB-10118-sp]
MLDIKCNPSDALVSSLPFTQDKPFSMELTNTHKTPVAFKIRVTSRKSFCVVPNMGRIEAGQQVKVIITLKAVKEDLPKGTECKHKLSILSVDITPERERFPVRRNLWTSVPGDAIHEQKFRVRYVFPDATAAQDASAAGTVKGLKAQLEEAQAEIQRLRSLVESGSVPLAARGAGLQMQECCSTAAQEKAIARYSDDASLFSEMLPSYHECTEKDGEMSTKPTSRPSEAHRRRSSGMLGRLSRVFPRAASM